MLSLSKKILLLVILLISPNVAKAEERQIKCLAKVVFHEARGEPLEGKIAVANVVLNRVNSKLFPNSICEVVYEAKQFSGIQRRTNYDNFSGKRWDSSRKAALAVYEGKHSDNTQGALFYLNPNKVRKNVLTSWNRKYKLIKDIHNHRFYGVKNI